MDLLTILRHNVESKLLRAFNEEMEILQGWLKRIKFSHCVYGWPQQNVSLRRITPRGYINSWISILLIAEMWTNQLLTTNS